MCTSGSDDNSLVDAPAAFMHKLSRRRVGLFACAALSALFILAPAATQAQSLDWELPAVESHTEMVVSRWTPSTFATNQAAQSASTVKLLAQSEVTFNRKA